MQNSCKRVGNTAEVKVDVRLELCSESCVVSQDVTHTFPLKLCHFNSFLIRILSAPKLQIRVGWSSIKGMKGRGMLIMHG